MPVAELQVSAEMEGAQALHPHDVLALPMARAAVLQHTVDSDVAPLLTLFHAGKEVSWDDPRHFAFAKALVSGGDFSAVDLAHAAGLDWAETAPMLEALLEEGLVVPASSLAAAAARHDNRPMPSPLPPAPMAVARCWTDPQLLMADLTGTALDTYWLEVVVPVFRTAHIFLDRDGRHVGEANAFPAAARTEVPTEWRGCPYAGNRYQPDKPMNMTALKAMRAHWRQMMGLLLPIREAYLRRFPQARAGWTVAHVERLAVCVLALPSYMLLRNDGRVANGDLHPALSNLFRVTDGLRMVMHHMLFVPLFEPMQRPDAPVTIETILAYADRNFLFHSEHGVCAGPRFMVEDFLGVLLSGQAPRSGFDAEIDPELQATAALIEPAMDYGLLGLQTFGAVFALWPAMARCYDRLHALLAGGSTAEQELADRFAGHFAALSHRSFLASEEWRMHREAVYDDMFASCAQGLGAGSDEPHLSTLLSRPEGPGTAQAAATLEAAVSRRFADANPALSAAFADQVVVFLTIARNIVALAEAIQARTAKLLQRGEPADRLTLQNINLHNILMGADQRSVPFLPDELGELFDLHIHVDAQTIEITPGVGRKSAHSPAKPAADTRA
ncbi:hypothetical protein HGI47_03990 [Novosphingobium sp. ERN07]|nr:hypothetical protein [Novosphingobium sp. ERN07]